MPSKLHFLNVKQGDCTWIKHADGKNSIIDVFNVSSETQNPDTLIHPKTKKNKKYLDI